MNDTAPKAAVIAAGLPYIDRRSLSEAWFSALHLASDGPALPGAPERRSAPQPQLGPHGAATRRVDPVRGSVSTPTKIGLPPLPASPGDAAALERRSTSVRAPHRPSARSRAQSYPPFRTSLTIGLEKQRVQLLLRRDGGTLHVVALCNPRVADIVRRALTCADAHLRARGEAVRSSVHVLGSDPVPA